MNRQITGGDKAKEKVRKGQGAKALAQAAADFNIDDFPNGTRLELQFNDCG